MNDRKEINWLTEAFARLQREASPLYVSFAVVCHDIASFDERSPSGWQRITDVRISYPGHTQLLSRIIGKPDKKPSILGDTKDQWDSGRDLLRHIRQADELLQRMADGPCRSSLITGKYRSRQSCEHWLHQLVTASPNCISAHTVDDLCEIVDVRIDDIAEECRLLCSRLAVFCEGTDEDSSTWPVMGTNDAAAALDVDQTTVRRRAARDPKQIQKERYGRYRVNPNAMTPKGRKKWR